MLVLKREWTMARWLAKAGSRRSGKYGAELEGGELAFVDDDLGGERRDEVGVQRRVGRGADGVVGLLADDVELALEGVLVELVGRGDEDLLDDGFAGAGGGAEEELSAGTARQPRRRWPWSAMNFSRMYLQIFGRRDRAGGRSCRRRIGRGRGGRG